MGCDNARLAPDTDQSVEFNAITYQIHMAVTALVAHHNRTGAALAQAA